MARNEITSAFINGLLKTIALGGIFSVTLLAPNALLALDKPVRKYLTALDARQSEQELRRLRRYMLNQGLVAEDYQHGLTITTKGLHRLKNTYFDQLTVTRPYLWDKHWRLVLFDIPENHKLQRMALTSKLKHIGFQFLQQSIWIHPFPCRQEVQVICEHLQVSKYVTYIETTHIDHSEKLEKRFQSILK